MFWLLAIETRRLRDCKLMIEAGRHDRTTLDQRRLLEHNILTLKRRSHLRTCSRQWEIDSLLSNIEGLNSLIVRVEREQAHGRIVKSLRRAFGEGFGKRIPPVLMVFGLNLLVGYSIVNSAAKRGL